MRISTNTMIDTGVSRILELQASLAKMQDQLATQRRVLTPSDDPIAASHALEVSQSAALNAQYATNRQNAVAALSAEEGSLNGITQVMQDARNTIISAGNPALSDSERSYLATQLRSHFDQLLSLANTTDSTGRTIFSGFQTGSPAFALINGNVVYQGDQGQRLLQVDSSRSLALSDSGDAIFNTVLNGNGSFTTAANPANLGTGGASLGTVTNLNALTGHNYEITFAVSGTDTTYTIADLTAGTPVPALPAIPLPIPYVPGQQIAFDGMQFDITGTPQNNDKFTVKPSTNQNIFKTLDDMIQLLQTPITTPQQKTALSAGITSAANNLDRSLDRVLIARAGVGSRLKELDTLDAVGSDRDLQYQQTLQDLQGLDLVKATSDLVQQKSTLEAAMQSFTQTSKLTLFGYL